MNTYFERAIRAMDPAAPGDDPELQRKTAIILEHLHAMIEELRPTDTELYAAMQWLNGVGRDNDFIMLCDVMGLTMRSVDLTHGRPDATASNVEGPFPKDDVPLYGNPVSLAREGEPGQRVTLRGRVLRADTGAPVPGALFEVWQTNGRGRYENEDDTQPENNFRGKFRTAEDGSYTLYTIVPGPYEIGTLHSSVGRLMTRLGRGRRRAAHVHYKVSHDGLRSLTSQFYFAGHASNADDCIFSARPENMVELRPDPEHPGQMVGEFDIRLAASD
jgi:catechol 1,2-dioxygenase